ncbi:MAG: hypothetical protein JO246_13565 [Frankiaceae bacterium]|nr:hypothetical protein [Frankiaceae bacterium]
MIHVGALVLALLYVVWAPHTADLAGQTARADLFDRSGFVPYWAGWYGGFPTTSYSLTTPALLGWFGAVWLGALSIVATSLVAVPLLRSARRPAAGAQLVVIVATLDVISGRTTFAVGVVVALATLLAAERDRGVLAVLLALLTTATSPVAGVLLLVVAVALFLVDGGRRRRAFGIAVAVVVALGVIAWLSPGGGGYEPLTRTSLLIAVGTAMIAVVAPVGRRVRMVALVSIAMLFVVFWVHSAIGANATRIAILGTAPAVVAASRGRITMAFWAGLALVLPLAQLHNDLAARGRVDTERSFTAPLAQAIAADPDLHGFRVEVVDTATHWPSTYLLGPVAIARGWQRQIDEERNPLFYGRSRLDATTYRAFLDRNAVGAIAVPSGVSLDYGAKDEAALIATGLPYLETVWRDSHWTLYGVADAMPIVPAPLVIESLTDTGVRFQAPAAGRYVVNLHYSPYLTMSGGSVSEAANGLSAVTVSRGGTFWLHAAWQVP